MLNTINKLFFREFLFFVFVIIILIFSLAFFYFQLTDQNQILKLCEKNRQIIHQNQTFENSLINNNLSFVPQTKDLAQSSVNSLEHDEYVIHRFWSHNTETSNIKRKIMTSFWSSLNTQSHARIIIWTLPSYVSYVTEQTQDMRHCGSSSLEVKSITEILHLLEATPVDSPLRMCIPSFQNAEPNMVAFSDLLRFIALHFFGGIYVDVDTLFLMDMKAFHGKSFAYKWDLNVDWYNTAIMGLPIKSDLVIKIITFFKGCNPGVFYPTTIHQALTCEGGICKELVMMPTVLFNPSSSSPSNYQWFQTLDKKNLLHGSTDWFFNQERFWDLTHFYPGSYTFHWHNRWDMQIHPGSFYADFERLHSKCNFNTGNCRKLFLDLGGYTGDTLKLWGESQDEIFVFEIDPGKVSAINQLLDSSLHHLKGITKVIHAAAWNTDTVIDVILTGHNDGRVLTNGGSKVLAYDIGKWISQNISLQSCDEFLLKIDIEGAEVEVLTSLNDYGILKLVDHLIIEWHDWIMPNVEQSKKKLENLLKENGLEFKYATLDDKIDIKYWPGDPWPVNHCDSHYFPI